jgi:hypothetical protein
MPSSCGLGVAWKRCLVRRDGRGGEPNARALKCDPPALRRRPEGRGPNGRLGPVAALRYSGGRQDSTLP